MTQIKLRRDTAANFTSKNPILGVGEPAYETDTKKLKIGDGTTAYTQLAYLNDTELNNPYSLFDSKYSDHELNNLSWLKSEGQWNSKTVYTDAYNKLLNVYNGKETVVGLSVKLSTETYTDYDFVLNTTDETFRLPLKTNLASGKAVVGNGMTLGLTDGVNNIGLRGGMYASTPIFNGSTLIYGSEVGATTDESISSNGKTVGVTTDSSKSGIELSDSGLYLYFYVGETVQNANLIDAGKIGEQLATKTDMLQASGAGMPSNKYIDLTLGASGTKYTAPANGYYAIDKTAGAQYQYITLVNTTAGMAIIQHAGNDNNYHCAGFIPVRKGDILAVNYGATGTTNYFRFIYAEGSK